MRLRAGIITIAFTVAVMIGLPSCSSTDEIPVDYPETQAYGLTPAEFDSLRYPAEDTEGNAITDSVTEEVEEPIEEPDTPIIPDEHETEEEPLPDETPSSSTTTEEETATEPTGAEEEGDDMMAGSDPSNYLVTDDGRLIMGEDGSIGILRTSDGRYILPDGTVVDSIEGIPNVYIIGEETLTDPSSADNADALTVPGMGWIEPDEEVPEEDLSGGIDPSVIEEISRTHDEIYSEHGPSLPARIFRTALPYALALIAGAVFVTIAVFAIKLSSGTFSTKRSRAREEYLRRKEEEELNNAPVIDISKPYSSIGKRPKELGEKKVRVGNNEVSRDVLIENDLIKLSDLIDTDSVPYPEEMTLSGLLRREGYIA